MILIFVIGIYMVMLNPENLNTVYIADEAVDIAHRLQDNRYGGKPKFYIYVDDIPDVLIYPPVSGMVSSNYGMRKLFGRTRMHAGTDIAAKHGSPIYSALAGIVTKANWYGSYGLLIEVDHGNGIVTRYGHCSAIMVRPGEAVDKGEYIGQVGSTGRSTGPHVHFEIRINGNTVDPAEYLFWEDQL